VDAANGTPDEPTTLTGPGSPAVTWWSSRARAPASAAPPRSRAARAGLTVAARGRTAETLPVDLIARADGTGTSGAPAIPVVIDLTRPAERDAAWARTAELGPPVRARRRRRRRLVPRILRPAGDRQRGAPDAAQPTSDAVEYLRRGAISTSMLLSASLACRTSMGSLALSGTRTKFPRAQARIDSRYSRLFDSPIATCLVSAAWSASRAASRPARA
jgi:hypothetical protein